MQKLVSTQVVKTRQPAALRLQEHIRITQKMETENLRRDLLPMSKDLVAIAFKIQKSTNGINDIDPRYRGAVRSIEQLMLQIQIIWPRLDMFIKGKLTDGKMAQDNLNAWVSLLNGWIAKNVWLVPEFRGEQLIVIRHPNTKYFGPAAHTERFEIGVTKV
jgi:hypothetical protein